VTPAHEVADVLEAHWQDVQQNGKFSTWQLRTLDAIKRCRTAAMGAHVDACIDCGHLQISYNSCRNRHCPKCQGIQRERWIQAREQELLPVPYFHVVFTLPDLLNTLCLHRSKILYGILFKTVWSVLLSFGDDQKWLGARTGMIAILHTWGQTLSLHPHLHCIVPGGGLTPQGKWRTAKSQGKYLFPVKAMSKVFRARFIAALKKELPDKIDNALVTELYKKDWVIYAKRPFNGPESVIEYLGRYTHKIAISNHRLKHIADSKVTFSYKDYRQNGNKKEMTLDASEFIRRFALHILPRAFVRMRHYGILSNTAKAKCAIQVKAQLPGITIQKTNKPLAEVYNPKRCPCCQQDTMLTILHFSRRGPPKNWTELAQNVLASLN
jgi:Putative transposase/Transposase zinc-binding domain